jgi:hypothetical protein
MNATVFYRSFSRIPIQNRIGNLAVTLNRIADSLERHQNIAGTKSYIQEAMWFIEWINPESNLEQAEQMAQLQRELGFWRKSIDLIWNDPIKQAQTQTLAREWSNRALEWGRNEVRVG